MTDEEIETLFNGFVVVPATEKLQMKKWQKNMLMKIGNTMKMGRLITMH